MKLIFALILFSMSPAYADLVGASQMSTFRLHDCRGTRCLSVSATEAEVSRTMTSLSARNASIKLGEVAMTCAAFRYDLKTQFVMCDNRDVAKDSITISADLSVQRFAGNR